MTVLQTIGCQCYQCETTRNASAWVALVTAAREDRARRVAKRSPHAPSLKLHAADYGIAPVRAWGMCDRAVATNRLARTILALTFRQRSTPLYGDTVWTQAREIIAAKNRRGRIAAYVASTR